LRLGLIDVAVEVDEDKGIGVDQRSRLTLVVAPNAAGAHSDTHRAWERARAQQRLPADLRQELLDAIYDHKPFRDALRDLGLTSNQVWGLSKTEEEWSAALEAALTATRRGDLKHGTNAAYVAGCVCKECREHQRRRMARNCS
jgi:hypothetical protein